MRERSEMNWKYTEQNERSQKLPEVSHIFSLGEDCSATRPPLAAGIYNFVFHCDKILTATFLCLTPHTLMGSVSLEMKQRLSSRSEVRKSLGFQLISVLDRRTKLMLANACTKSLLTWTESATSASVKFRRHIVQNTKEAFFTLCHFQIFSKTSCQCM